MHPLKQVNNKKESNVGVYTAGLVTDLPRSETCSMGFVSYSLRLELEMTYELVNVILGAFPS